MKMETIISFAKQQGYDNAIYLGKWKGYDAYEPVFDGADVSFVGLPYIILAKGDTVRMSTVKKHWNRYRTKRKIKHLNHTV